jgi:hypothetical protein
MSTKTLMLAVLAAVTFAVLGCDEEQDVAYVAIHNYFNNPDNSFNPPWTICESSYLGVEFGKIEIGATTDEHEVTPGLGYVLMVAAWDDPTCDPAHALPIATTAEEEVVSGQHRTITIEMNNHQGPCPPEGVAPIPEDLYEQVRSLWPSYGFQAYANRTQNTQCTQ